MSEEEITSAMVSVWKVLVAEKPEHRDKAMFELYRQRECFRKALERIAGYPEKVWSQQLARKALDSMLAPPGQSGESDQAIESAVNRGLAVTALRHDVSAGAELMCREGVPLDVGRRVLLHPKARRATDWRSPADVLGVHPVRKTVQSVNRPRRAG